MWSFYEWYTLASLGIAQQMRKFCSPIFELLWLFSPGLLFASGALSNQCLSLEENCHILHEIEGPATLPLHQMLPHPLLLIAKCNVIQAKSARTSLLTYVDTVAQT